MRRAGRIIYNGAMALSLLLCLACTGVWVRSGWVSDEIGWDEGLLDNSCVNIETVWISRGGVQFTAYRLANIEDNWGGRHFGHYAGHADKYPSLEEVLAMPLNFNVARYSALGFEVVVKAENTRLIGPGIQVINCSFTLPLYFPTLLFALLPARYFLRVRRRRRAARRLTRGCCPACGYDLRASAGRCPECGAPGAAGPACDG